MEPPQDKHATIRAMAGVLLKVGARPVELACTEPAGQAIQLLEGVGGC